MRTLSLVYLHVNTCRQRFLLGLGRTLTICFHICWCLLIIHWGTTDFTLLHPFACLAYAIRFVPLPPPRGNALEILVVKFAPNGMSVRTIEMGRLSHHNPAIEWIVLVSAQIANLCSASKDVAVLLARGGASSYQKQESVYYRLPFEIGNENGYII